MMFSCPFLLAYLQPMQKPGSKKIFKWLKIIAVVYVAGGIALYFLQDAILFHPVSLKKDHRYDFTEKHKDINIPIDDETILNIIQFLTEDSLPKGVVLYFHGNKKNISWYAKYSSYFTRHGYEVWMIDYPGFGKSTGKLTEQILYDRALTLYRFARTRFGTDSIILYGKSMGTGIAAQLASVRDCKRLILETPYYDFPSVIQHYLPIYPVNSLLHYEIPTWKYLQNVTAPVTIFQGTKDRVITYKNAARLKKYLKQGDEFIDIPKGHHNNLYDFPILTKKLDSLLSR